MGKLTDEFLAAINEIEETLFLMGFSEHSFEQKGHAYFIDYKRGETVVTFQFAPSDWDTEMFIETAKGKYQLIQLLANPAISKWFEENRYVQTNGRSIRNEILYQLEMLKVSLPILE